MTLCKLHKITPKMLIWIKWTLTLNFEVRIWVAIANTISLASRIPIKYLSARFPVQFWHPKLNPPKPFFLSVYKTGFTVLKTGGYTRFLHSLVTTMLTTASTQQNYKRRYVQTKQMVHLETTTPSCFSQQSPRARCEVAHSTVKTKRSIIPDLNVKQR